MVAFALSSIGRVRRGFTLVEVLVVISIIAILIGILLPSLGKARDAGRAVVCLSNQRQIGMGLSSYANAYAEWTPRESGTSELTFAGVRGLVAPAHGQTPVPQQVNLAWAFNLRPFVDPLATDRTRDGGLSDKYRLAPYYRDPARPKDPHNIHYVVNGLAFTAPGVLATYSKPPTRLNRYANPVATMYLTCFIDDAGGTRWGNWYQATNDELEVAVYYDMWRASNVTGQGGGDHTTFQRIATNRHGRGANAVFMDGHARFARPQELTELKSWDDGHYRRF